jgi:hypothetical protein
MSLPNDASVGLADPAGPVNTANEAAASADVSAERPTFEGAVGQLLSEARDGAAESADPVAGLDTAVQAVALELGRRSDPGEDPAGATTPSEIEAAIETLVNVALDADDPVAALEEGADSLAEALAARDAAAEEWLRAASERQAGLQGAYQHARLHRVMELMDVGYDLDQAVAITNTNEAQIRARAIAAGRHPMEPIYDYAVLNGYRSTEPGRPETKARDDSVPATLSSGGRQASTMETLVHLTDEAFAEATRGDRWERLMRR